MRRVAHVLLLSAWIRSSRATRLAHPLRTTDGRLRRPPADAARDDEWEPSVGSSDHRRRREPAAPHVALAAMRAITHVVGKAIRSSRRPRRGAGWWLRTTMAPPAGADVEQPDDVAAGVGGPSSSHRERMLGRTSRWGRGSLGHSPGRSRDVRSRPPVCARGRGRRHAPGRRARVSSGARARREPRRTPASVQQRKRRVSVRGHRDKPMNLRREPGQ